MHPSIKSRLYILFLLVILLIVFVAIKPAKRQTPVVTPSPTPTPAANSISDGLITIEYPDDFGLATNPTQILVKSYIPPCDENFNYCLYYNDAAFVGTNFESAGLRVSKRADLSNERLCLETPPAGFSDTLAPQKLSSTDASSASLFNNMSDAAAGHYANGALYRLYVRNPATCYEFQIRIGQSRFENYPEGTIKEFTSDDQDVVKQKLEAVVNSISLAGKKNLF